MIADASLELRAPFPWFGGKSRARHLVWQAIGDVPNYVEPFAGSLAVLLGRPSAPRIETVNDLDCYLANFWRAVQAAPDEVAHHADWPVNEADLHARHRWLVGRDEFRERMRVDPEYFDAKVAGWWVWGICQWIGSGWCSAPEWTGRANASRAPRGVYAADYRQRPRLSGEQGVLRNLPQKLPLLGGTGIGKGVHSDAGAGVLPQKRPHLASTGLGRGVHSDAGVLRERDLSGASEWQKRPVLGRGGRGVYSQLPSISGSRGASGRGVHASAADRNQGGVYDWMTRLADRLRRVRVCCGDWRRVLGPAATTCIGVTGVLLDPPYADTAGRDPSLYAHDSLTVAHDGREWALANGDDPKLRIVLCGLEGEHDMPPTWRCIPWKAQGGYGKNNNRHRERLWLSPHCLPIEPKQAALFTEVA